MIAGLCVSPLPAYADCADPAGTMGKIIYNGDTNAPQFCNGADWIALGAVNPSAGGDGCDDPAGTEGQIIYNGDIHIPQYCDGDDWRAMIGYVNSCDNEGASCTLDSVTVPHGESETFYSAEEHANCASISQERTCDDGELDGSASYQYASCSAPSGPTGCDNIGDTCSDGTIYAGLSPDGNVPMYTTPADASSGAYWGTYNFPTGSTSNVTGKANSADIYAHVQNGDGDYNPDDSYTPNAAVLCEELTAHGHSDWYLPARDELDVLYDNLVDQNGDNTPGGPLGSTFGFNTSGSYPAGWYWSSSEVNNSNARFQRFGGGNQSFNNKYYRLSVRCVRR